MQTNNPEYIQSETELLGEADRLAAQIGIFVNKLRRRGDINRTGEHFLNAPQQPLDQRWISEGATDLQKGFMSIRRGISQTKGF